jgi:hypothetical protein
MSQGHIGTLYPRTYLSWCATARIVSDLGKEVGDTTISNGPGLIFGDGAFIEIANEVAPEGSGHILKWTFKCITGREEIESTSLAEVMDFLWYTHSMNEWPNA